MDKLAKICRIRTLPFLGAFLLLISIYTALSFRPRLKSWLESELSRIHSSQVEIGNLVVHWKKQELELSNIQITNPRRPLRNLVELDQIRFRVPFESLVRRRLKIEEIQIKGIQYDTSRLDSGNMRESTALPPQVEIIEGMIPGIFSPVRGRFGNGPLNTIPNLVHSFDVIQPMRRITPSLASTKAAENLQQELNKVKDEWTKLETTLPSLIEIEQLERNIALNKQPKTRRKLKETLKQKQRMVKKVLGTMRNNYLELRQAIRKLDQLKHKDFELVAREISFPDLKLNDVSDQIFGPKLLNALERFSYWVAFLRRFQPISQPSKPLLIRHSKGNEILFSPRSLIQIGSGQISSFGKASIGHYGQLTGNWTPFSFLPTPTGSVSTLNLEGHFFAQGIRGFSFQMKNSVQENPTTTINFRVEELPISQWRLNESGNLQLSVRKAIGSLDFFGEYAGDQLSAKLRLKLQGAQYDSESRSPRLANLLKEETALLQDFAVEANLSGPFDDLKLKVSSPLGRQLARALKKEFRSDLSALEDQMMEYIQTHIRKAQENIETQVQHMYERRLRPLERIALGSTKRKKTPSSALAANKL